MRQSVQGRARAHVTYIKANTSLRPAGDKVPKLRMKRNSSRRLVLETAYGRANFLLTAKFVVSRNVLAQLG